MFLLTSSDSSSLRAQSAPVGDSKYSIPCREVGLLFTTSSRPVIAAISSISCRVIFSASAIISSSFNACAKPGSDRAEKSVSSDRPWETVSHSAADPESSYTTAAVANRQRCFMGSSESVDLTPPEFRVGDFRFPRVPNYISLSFVLHFLALFESEILQFRKNVLI